jgi:predicted nuclease with TOPRIM domain
MQIKEEYLTTIRELRDNFNAIVVSLGQISIQKANLENNEKLLQQEYIKFEAEERELLSKIETEYGQGDLDINTGDFTPNK